MQNNDITIRINANSSNARREIQLLNNSLTNLNRILAASAAASTRSLSGIRLNRGLFTDFSNLNNAIIRSNQSAQLLLRNLRALSSTGGRSIPVEFSVLFSRMNGCIRLCGGGGGGGGGGGDRGSGGGDLSNFAAIAGIGASISTAISAAFQKAYENTLSDRLLVTATGDKTIASIEKKYIEGLADKYGQDVNTLKSQFAKFQIGARDTELQGIGGRKVFEAFIKTGISAGLTNEEIKRVFTAIGQMISKGIVSSEELKNQLADSLPGTLKASADALNITVPELMKKLEKGEVESISFLKKLASVLDKNFNVGSQEASKDNISDINRFLNKFNQNIAIPVGELALSAASSASKFGTSILDSPSYTSGILTSLGFQALIPAVMNILNKFTPGAIPTSWMRAGPLGAIGAASLGTLYATSDKRSENLYNIKDDETFKKELLTKKLDNYAFIGQALATAASIFVPGGLLAKFLFSTLGGFIAGNIGRAIGGETLDESDFQEDIKKREEIQAIRRLDEDKTIAIQRAIQVKSFYKKIEDADSMLQKIKESAIENKADNNKELEKTKNKLIQSKQDSDLDLSDKEQKLRYRISKDRVVTNEEADEYARELDAIKRDRIQKEEEFIISLNEINAKIKDIGYSKTDKADIKKAENIKKLAEESLSKFTEEDLIKYKRVQEVVDSIKSSESLLADENFTDIQKRESVANRLSAARSELDSLSQGEAERLRQSTQNENLSNIESSFNKLSGDQAILNNNLNEIVNKSEIISSNLTEPIVMDINQDQLNQALEKSDTIRKNLEIIVRNSDAESEGTTDNRQLRFAKGGLVPGFGGGDIVSALLEPGEFVVNKNRARMFKPLLSAINTAPLESINASNATSNHQLVKLDLSINNGTTLSVHTRKDSVRDWLNSNKEYSRGKIYV